MGGSLPRSFSIRSTGGRPPARSARGGCERRGRIPFLRLIEKLGQSNPMPPRERRADEARETTGGWTRKTAEQTQSGAGPAAVGRVPRGLSPIEAKFAGAVSRWLASGCGQIAVCPSASNKANFGGLLGGDCEERGLGATGEGEVERTPREAFQTRLRRERSQTGKIIRRSDFGHFGEAFSMHSVGLIGIDRRGRRRHDSAAGWGLALLGFAVAGCRPNLAVTLGRGSDPTCRLHNL
ncbi:hypothetical protein BSF38_01237 [Paludisphaera borealis]|uniref:Uncharacterized protein n=1 Tax=Paludisphaera borealis TaxID=1387353 RepID=A0A1U7CLH8_9BACT|nr:hypothetical protein BSF38_01237 [Paludisphaera borealis]